MMAPLPLTPDGIDKLFKQLDDCTDRLGEAQGSMVRKRKAELNFLSQVEALRDMIEGGLKTNKDREALQNTLGGDCERISHLKAVLETVQLTDSSKNDKRFISCVSVCSTVEKVLSDMGLGEKLRSAQQNQVAKVKRRQTVMQTSLEGSLILAALNPTPPVENSVQPDPELDKIPDAELEQIVGPDEEVIVEPLETAQPAPAEPPAEAPAEVPAEAPVEPPAKASAPMETPETTEIQAAAPKRKPNAKVETLEKALGDMRGNGFEVVKVSDATSVFGAFNKGVRDAVKLGREGKELLDVVEDKSRVLTFLQKYAKASPKLSSRVTGVLKILFAFDSWAEVAEADPDLLSLYLATTPEEFLSRHAEGAAERGAAGVLLVHVEAARNLVAGSAEPATPLVRVRVGDQEKETEMAEGLDPRFCVAPMMFDVPSADTVVRFEAVDHGTLLGYVEFPASEAFSRLGPRSEVHFLQGAEQGELELEVVFATKAEKEEAVEFAPQKRINRAWGLRKSATEIPVFGRSPRGARST